MRILLVTDWALSEGGTERYVRALRDGLRLRENDVRLLTSTVGSTVSASADYTAYGSKARAPRALTQVVNPAAAWTASRVRKAFRPDVVHLNMFLSYLSPAVVPAFGDVPIVLSLHDYRAVCPVGLKRLPNGSICRERAGMVCLRSGCISPLRAIREPVRGALIAGALARAAAVLTCSKWMTETLAAVGVPSQSVPLPVEAPRITPLPRADHPVFVYGGRLDPEKGVDVLLHAFAETRRVDPRAELRICGDGRERGRLEALARGLGIRATFVPGMRENWWSAAAGAWAVVVPSVWDEPLGLVAIEAILRGIPVIASDCGGLAETLVDGRTGLLSPRADAAALAERMIAVAGQRALTAPPPAADVRALSDKHDPAEHSRRICEIYEAVGA